jgi:hypothetical protein
VEHVCSVLGVSERVEGAGPLRDHEAVDGGGSVRHLRQIHARLSLQAIRAVDPEGHEDGLVPDLAIRVVAAGGGLAYPAPEPGR